MKRIIVDLSCLFTRMVLTEDGSPIEYICESKNDQSLVGNIYVGRVESVLKGMKSFFVDIGMDKNVYVMNEKGTMPKINSHIMEQIMKDAIGEKGPVGTEKISFTGRFVVLIPGENGNIGVSKKIADSAERERIESIVKSILPENYGIIVRTQGEGKSEYEFKEEINYLYAQSEEILKKANFVRPPAVMKKDNNFVASTAKNWFDDTVDEFVINDRETFLKMQEIFSDKKEKIIFYDEAIPVFESFFVESKLEKIFSKKIWLKSGGFIVIEQTEACVVIDVNTGKFTGKKDFEKTKLKTNLEAAEEIALQMRLRNLTGMIIVDFIDMDKEESKQELEEFLRAEVKKDRIKTTVVGMTELGLMQITRQKTRVPVLNTISEECKTCISKGYVPSYTYVADRILRQVSSVFAQTIFDEVTIRSNKRVLNALNSEKGKYIKEIENKFNKKIILSEIETAAADYFELEKIKKGCQ